MKTHHFTTKILHFLFHTVSFDHPPPAPPKRGEGTFLFKRKVWLLLLLSTFIIISISQAAESPKKSFFEVPPRITVEELKRKLDHKADVIVVDVRGDFPFEQERIKDAIFIPLEEVEARQKEFLSGKEIVFY
jgi:hypothetical protein